MRNYKLITDSSANPAVTAQGVNTVPLKILLGIHEYVDTPDLDTALMLEDMKHYSGSSGSACPAVQDFLNAFGDADEIFAATISSGVSGCYNAAAIAANMYMADNSGKKVFVLDSLSTGPELQLIMEKLQELVQTDLTFEEICRQVKAYRKDTHLLFSLESLENLAKNGRCSMVVAKAAGILGIRVVGRASDEGTLEPLHKCRGEKQALHRLFSSMKEAGFRGGKVRISHTYNPRAAVQLTALIHEEFPHCDVEVVHNGGLCAFYSENGGLLLGFEG